MSLLQLAYESAYEVIDLIWVDLATLMACFVFYVLGVVCFRKKASSKIAPDGPLDRLRNISGTAVSVLKPGNRRPPQSQPKRLSMNPAVKLESADRSGSQVERNAAGPNVATFSSLLKGCHASGDLRKAKEILKEMAAIGLKPNEQTYNTFINLAVTKGDFQVVWDIVEMRKQAGVPVDSYLVSILMKTLRQRDSRLPLHSSHVPRVFRFLDESDVDFCSDEVMLTTVVDACIWHKEHSRVERILESYFTSRLVPTVPVYPSLVKASKCIKRMDLVWRLWREVVEDRELKPSVILFGSMLDALVCDGSTDKAFELFQEWKVKVAPTTVVYSTLVKGLLNTQQYNRAMEMLTEMRAAGVPRSTVLYNQIISAFATQGDLDKIKKLMCSMVEDGCTPDVITYSVVVKRYCVLGDFDSVRSVLRQAQKSRVALDAIVYSSIFYGCYKHRRHNLVDEFVEHMRPFGLKPSSFTLSIIVKMYGGQGLLDRAFEVIGMLSSHADRKDTRVMAALLGECTRNGDLARAEPLLQALLSSGGPDAKTFWPYAVLCVRSGEFQKGQVAVEKWQLRTAAKDVRIEKLVLALQERKESESLTILSVLRREASVSSKDEE